MVNARMSARRACVGSRCQSQDEAERPTEAGLRGSGSLRRGLPSTADLIADMLMVVMTVMTTTTLVRALAVLIVMAMVLVRTTRRMAITTQCFPRWLLQRQQQQQQQQ